MSFLSGAAEGAFLAIQDYAPAAARSVMAGAALAASVSSAQAGDDRTRYVNKHIVITFDRSDSVDTKESEMLFKGVAAGLQGVEAQAYLNQGICYAMTAVVFSGSAKAAPSVIVCSTDDVRNYAQTMLWDSTTSSISPNLPYVYSATTSVRSALAAAAALFDQEEALGFISEARSVLVIGDGQGEDPGKTMETRNLLAEKYNASVSGVVVDGGDDDSDNTLNFYKEAVCTPEGALYHDASGYTVRIQQGACLKVPGFEGVEAGVGKAMSVIQF